MPSNLTCPNDAELLAVAAGEEPRDEVGKHLADCPGCRKRLEDIRAELALLRAGAPDAGSAPSTANDPETDQASTNGQEAHAGTAGPWEAAESTSRRPSESVTDLAFTREAGGPDDRPLPPAIGKYLVIGRFPRTGQAEVFRVVHPGLARDLVLKLALNPIEPGGRHEIIEEGKILAGLKHSHLVQVHDLDWHDDRPYLVMEYIRGRSLDQLSSEGRLKPRQAAALLAKVTAAADYAHRHGITHRDIKPKNILVDEAGEPKLIDFGMARLRHAWSEEPGKPGGTFAFMAPEQARVESPEEQQKVGPRSDVFALGAVLYYLLTGKAPFEAPTWRESWDRARRCDFDAAALSDRKIPPALRRICLKAMAPDPVERFASAEELARSLNAFLRRPYLVVGLALAVLIPAAAFGAWSNWPSTKPSQGPPVVIHQTLTTPNALAGELIVRVWSNDGQKRGLRVEEPGALPLRPGEQVHLEARLTQPAYSYLLWLDGQGRVSLLFPRNDGKFGSPPFDGSARDTVHSPEALDEGHRMSGPPGLETALLLVRRTPLPADTDLAAMVGKLPPSPLRDNLEVAVRGFDDGQPTELLKVDLHRSIDEETERIDDPLLQLMEKLRKQGHFDVIKAVRFAYQGR